MHIVLLEPEIPQNAGNIARTCAVTNSVLHLIKPLGFSVEDKYLKRAGLDYWKLLDIRYYENFEDFCERNPNAKIWMASTKARHIYADVKMIISCLERKVPASPKKSSWHMKQIPFASLCSKRQEA